MKPRKSTHVRLEGQATKSNAFWPLAAKAEQGAGPLADATKVAVVGISVRQLTRRDSGGAATGGAVSMWEYV